MGQPKRQSYEDRLLESIPNAADLPEKSQSKQVVEELNKLPKKEQLKVLKRLGVRPGEPLHLSTEFNTKLLSVVAEVAFNLPSETKGKTPGAISTPTGGQSKRRR